MRKIITSEPRWVWFLLLVLVGMVSLGYLLLPQVLVLETPAPGGVSGFYILSLITLTLFIGLLISVAFERYERLMVILFVGFRIGQTAWGYQLGRHSLWYLAFSVIAHVAVGSLVLLFLSGPFNRKKS